MQDVIEIKVLFFAALREQLGFGERLVSVPRPATIRDVWVSAVPGQPIPAHILVARNQTYSGFDESVSEGDEIAFFPPVTGG